MKRDQTSSSIFERFFCCGNAQEVEQPKNKYTTIDQYLKSTNREAKLYKLQQIDGFHYDKARKIKTSHSMRDIKFCDALEEVAQYPCPICFRYFNFILTSSCCYNYICHLCAIEYKSPKCHFCQNESCKYMDADSKQLKVYTDSQGIQLFAMLQRDTTMS